ncbi:MAG: Mov34/MPN/PAD-1 family protein [Candidatus Bathyarchaeia archaeon]
MNKIVKVNQQVIDSILSYAKSCHPKEGILLLRGKVKKDEIVVEEVEIPPLAVHGDGFSNFPLYMLPVDLSVIGTAHSHPSGVLYPSIVDLNHFYGRVMIIAAYPYISKRDVAVFNGKGDPLEYKIVEV